MSASVFGISIEGGSGAEVLQRVLAARSTWVVTANPENMLTASEWPDYKRALLAADYRTVDGVGLWLVLRIRGVNVTRLTGVDLAEHVLREARDRRWRVAFLGGDPGVAVEAADAWRCRLPGLEIRAWSGGRIRGDGVEDGKTWEDREAVRAWNPDVLFCAFGGGGAKQELWIMKHRETFASCRVIMGIGGAFDMWTGRLRRAPATARVLGLEWLWRWILEPKRAGRMWRATSGFLWAVLRAKG